MKTGIPELTGQQVAELRRRFRQRKAQAMEAALRGMLAGPPLPRCPGCTISAERIDQRVEEPEFGVSETVLRLRWLPCGHVFRAPVDPSEGWL